MVTSLSGVVTMFAGAQREEKLETSDTVRSGPQEYGYHMPTIGFIPEGSREPFWLAVDDTVSRAIQRWTGQRQAQGLPQGITLEVCDYDPAAWMAGKVTMVEWANSDW